MNALAPMGPPGILASPGVFFRLYEQREVAGPVEVCAAWGVPLERIVETLAFVVPEGRSLAAALSGRVRLRCGALVGAAGIRRAGPSSAGAGRPAGAGVQPGGVCPVSADRAVVVFGGTAGGLGRVRCGSGRRGSGFGIEAAELMAAVPAAATASVADLPADGPT
ncbi:YbaK/EbsC family protein [Streptomyces hyaluromycini]|uniref:YbaK/EbsC family protein n=1 Tax=Streptomyces hyaluromycini TaxID=1377993 RepID=A0ABV1WQI6_9ACTN